MFDGPDRSRVTCPPLTGGRVPPGWQTAAMSRPLPSVRPSAHITATGRAVVNTTLWVTQVLLSVVFDDSELIKDTQSTERAVELEMTDVVNEPASAAGNVVLLATCAFMAWGRWPG